MPQRLPWLALWLEIRFLLLDVWCGRRKCCMKLLWRPEGVRMTPSAWRIGLFISMKIGKRSTN